MTGSAAFPFGTCAEGTSTDCVHQALQSAEGGLSREQSRSLLQGHVSSSAIDFENDPDDLMRLTRTTLTLRGNWPGGHLEKMCVNYITTT